MPYIKQWQRDEMGGTDRQHWTPGELNYAITKLLIDFIGPDRRYEKFNAAVGALESAKLEFYRRMVVPYEDGKIEDNGDVYP
jgi:hypothetical protein